MSVAGETLDWLKRFAAYELNDNQRTALVFLREVGAIDAVAYRQLTGCKPKLVAKELAGIRDLGLMIQKGRARGTYYVPAGSLEESIKNASVLARAFQPQAVTTTPSAVTTTPRTVMSTAQGVMMTPQAAMSTAQDVMMTPRQGDMPDVLQKKIAALKRRVPGKVMQSVIVELCAVRAMGRIELSKILKRSPVTIDRSTYVRSFLLELKKSKYAFTEDEETELADPGWCGVHLGPQKAVFLRAAPGSSRPNTNYWRVTYRVGYTDYWVNSGWLDKYKHRFDLWAQALAQRAGFTFEPYAIP